MKHVYVYAYNKVSNGAAELAHALNSPRIRHNGSRFKGAPWKTVINWGASEVPREVLRCNILNLPEDVRVAANKLLFFRRMKETRVPPWTESHQEAYDKWIVKEIPVVCRTVLTGHSGNGIVIANTREEMVYAPLYTQYIPKSHEFRVHIIKGNIIDVQRKIRDPDKEPKNWKVRSHDNGFIYVRGGFTLPSEVSKQAITAFMDSGLAYGAVDVIYQEKSNKAYVLECNTAPGLEGSTIENYANGFRQLLSR